ncbi:MAG: glycosyltransferase family 39 protein [Actinomycetota bacterium]|nr:glycosyltransferase family 39 protein [Actinomycetota bacterium]
MTDLAPSRTSVDPVWRRALVKTGLVYLFSRVCVAAGGAIVAAELRHDEDARLRDLPWARWADPHYAGKEIPADTVSLVKDVLTGWDGVWYLRIIRNGYPRHVAEHVNYDMSDARVAFFPTYPNLVRAIDWLLPGGPAFAALLVNFLLGALAVLLVGVLARRLFDVQVAERAMVLMAIFPGSFVLSFAYTEALLLVLVAATFWLLMDHRWVAAGLVAAMATATRPNGIAIVVGCAAASFVAIRARREWRSLAAPLLAPLGFIGFQLWLGHHTGERWVWFRVQTEAWGEGTSYGFTALRRTWSATFSPLTSPTNSITAVCLVTVIFLFWLLRRYQLPPAMVAFSIAIVVLMVLPETVTARPRFVYTAFPLLIPAAVWFERVRRDWWPWVLASCAVGLTTLTALYGVFGAVP